MRMQKGLQNDLLVLRFLEGGLASFPLQRWGMNNVKKDMKDFSRTFENGGICSMFDPGFRSHRPAL